MRARERESKILHASSIGSRRSCRQSFGPATVLDAALPSLCVVLAELLFPEELSVLCALVLALGDLHETVVLSMIRHMEGNAPL